MVSMFITTLIILMCYTILFIKMFLWRKFLKVYLLCLKSSFNGVVFIRIIP